MRRDEEPWHFAQTGFQLLLEARFRAEQSATGGHELVAPCRGDGDGVFDDAIEGEQRIVIENDRVELRRLNERFTEAVVDGALGEARAFIINALQDA